MDKETLNKLKYLVKKSASITDICEKLKLEEYQLRGFIEMAKLEGELFDINHGTVMRLTKPKQDSDVYTVPNNLTELKLLLISDTHLASKYDRVDILNYLYDKALSKNVAAILHAGDFTDGKSNRAEQQYELRELSYEGQVEYCVEKYPRTEKKTYTIAGNHDGWWYKSNGSDIVKAIAAQREDIVYLGPDVADLQIGKLKVRLFHGQGGRSYAKSYKLQRYIDNIPVVERPHILQTGHTHNAFYMKQDQTHCFQTSAIQDLTPFARGLGNTNEKSCWWVTIQMDDKGNPVVIDPQLEILDRPYTKRRYRQ